jgi:hypothetical protein
MRCSLRTLMSGRGHKHQVRRFRQWPAQPRAAAGWMPSEQTSLPSPGSRPATSLVTLSSWPRSYLDAAAHLADAHAICSRALQAARQTGGLAAQAESLRNISFIDLQRATIRKRPAAFERRNRQ